MEQTYLFNVKEDYYSFRFMGSRPAGKDEESGYLFSVWAPHAKSVSVVGQFNDWDSSADPMELVGETGIWVKTVPEAKQWDRYKYNILGADGSLCLKQDPYARHFETRPADASICYDPEDYIWGDEEYLQNLPAAWSERPINIYEVHLGSWRRHPNGNVMNYRQIATELAKYCKDMGYTHVELLPVMEHPLDASWGYQISGYYAVTSRFGTPADFKFLVDHLHQNGIGVLLDWVPAHFPKNKESLIRFDGSPCYEYADPMMGEHKLWGTCVFDYEKTQVRSFLLSNAIFWLSEFHADGLRVDAVSSMLYRNYNRKEYSPNKFGGADNLEAVDFFRKLNRLVSELFPHAFMMAEESTSWARVTGERDGGLGFTHKWNMGWMHDTLDFFSQDYIGRIHAKDKFTFSMMYAFSERFVLPFSHDEVVHGKKSLLDKMPGDNWRKFASLRQMYLYMMAHPGVKLFFMGSEFGPFIEWREYEELEWFMLEYQSHRLLRDCVAQLNHFYKENPAMWIYDGSWKGFEWLSIPENDEECIFAFQRMGKHLDERVIVVLNMIPAPMSGYRIPVAEPGRYRIVFNTDDMKFGGSGYPMSADREVVFAAQQTSWKGKEYFIELCLPPLGGLYLMRETTVNKDGRLTNSAKEV